MDQRIINLYDEYTHAPLTRNEFLKRLIQLTGSTAAAMAVLPLISKPGTRRHYLRPGSVYGADQLCRRTGRDEGLCCTPQSRKKYPTVVVIHENRGLNAHIEDVTRRLRTQGYLAIAPNALSYRRNACQ